MNAFLLIDDVVTPPLLCIIYSPHILAVLLSTSVDLQGTTRPRTLPVELSSTPPHLGRMFILTDVHIKKELTHDQVHTLVQGSSNIRVELRLIPVF